MRTEWVVLADENRARIFARVEGSAWQAIKDLSRAQAGTNGNGREVRLPEGLRKLDAVVSGNAGGNDFAARLANELVGARKRGDFDVLAMAAPTEFLERLKEYLDAATRRKLAATATDNLVGLPLREARRQIARRF